MKKLTRSLLVVGAMIAASSANAAIIDDINPLIGIDYQQVWMKANRGWANVFPKTYPGGTAYVGARFCECLGLELGYDWSGKQSNNFALSGSFFGNNITGPLNGTASVRRTGGHFDLIGYLPVVDCIELMGVIGVGYVYPQVKVSINANNASTNTLSTALLGISGRGKTVARLRIGGNYMFTECVGMRALVGWESTSSLRLKGNSTFGTVNYNSKPFKGSATAAAGVFVKF